jgi:hypothetical protein
MHSWKDVTFTQVINDLVQVVRVPGVGATSVYQHYSAYYPFGPSAE